MKKIISTMFRPKAIFSFFAILFIMFVPLVFTQATTSTSNGVNLEVRIKNPLASSGINTLPGFVEAAIKIVLIVGVPIVALAIIYAGFLFVTAQGNSEKLGEAKNTLMYTLIGAALLLGSWVIAQAIQGTVNDISGVV